MIKKSVTLESEELNNNFKVREDAYEINLDKALASESIWV